MPNFVKAAMKQSKTVKNVNLITLLKQDASYVILQHPLFFILISIELNASLAHKQFLLVNNAQYLMERPYAYPAVIIYSHKTDQNA